MGILRIPSNTDRNTHTSFYFENEKYRVVAVQSNDPRRKKQGPVDPNEIFRLRAGEFPLFLHPSPAGKSPGQLQKRRPGDGRKGCLTYLLSSTCWKLFPTMVLGSHTFRVQSGLSTDTTDTIVVCLLSTLITWDKLRYNTNAMVSLSNEFSQTAPQVAATPTFPHDQCASQPSTAKSGGPKFNCNGLESSQLG